MADQGERMGHYRMKSLPELTLFSISLVFILLFMYLNLYMLPLGTTSPDGAAENASDLYGLDIGVGGEVIRTTDMEFAIFSSDSSGSLKAIWNGDGDLPLNGTMVIAFGFIIASPAGPVLVCESIAPLRASDIIFENPWSLPSLRLMIINFLWFSLTTAATGLAVLASHFRPKILNEDRARVLTEVCALSGFVSFVCLALLSSSEPHLGIGIPTIALLIGFILLLIAVVMHWTDRHDVVEMSSALPIAASIMIMVGVLMIAVQQQLLAADVLGTALANFLPDFFISAVIGTFGFILMGVYLAERRYYAVSIRGLLIFGKEEVR